MPTNEKTDAPKVSCLVNTQLLFKSKQSIIFESAEIFVDPIEEAVEELAKERAELAGKVEPKIRGEFLKNVTTL